MLPTAAGIALLLWLFYSWKIAIGVAVMCAVFAAFYAGALEGEASEKTLRAFSILVIAVSVLMVVVFTSNTTPDGEGPDIKYCLGVQC